MRQDYENASYGSIADFLSAVELPCRNKRNYDIWRDYIEEHRASDWYGADCHSGKQVMQTMRDGWQAGRDRMNELRSQLSNIEAAPIDRRRRMVRGPAGDHLDIHLVYAGRLDIAWRSPRRVTTRGPQRVEICANMICSGFEHADVLFWRGACAAVLVDIFEAAGYMVRLVVAFGGSAEEKKPSCRVTVKDHGTPFDITSTSAVILPGFFRALGHAWLCNHAPHHRSCGGISVGQGQIEAGEYLISHGVRDHGTAVAFINDTIEKINRAAA